MGRLKDNLVSQQIKKKRRIRERKHFRKAGKDEVMPEDRELRDLEKKLGKQRNDLSSEFSKDGLDYVMDYLNESDDEEEEAIRGRKRKQQYQTPEEDSSEVKDEEKLMKKFSDKRVRFSDTHPDSEPSSCDPKSHDTISNSSSERQCYNIPQKRDSSSNIGLSTLRKKMCGLLNRLSESNLSSIVTELEHMYSRYSRNDVNSVLTDTMLKSTLQPVLVNTKMCMEHVMVITLLHSKLGTEVGAYFVEGLLKELVRLLNSCEHKGKEIDCCVLLLAHLYSFKVIHCVLVYDVIRKLLETFNEKSIELLVLLLKECGMEIRKDDPGSLKEIIKQIQAKSSDIDSSRVKFMFEVISAIKSNNSHKIPNYDPELKVHMKKLLKGLGKSLGATQVMDEHNQLKIPLQDLLEADSRGRWWIVGSSWTGRDDGKEGEVAVTTGTDESSEMLELARKQRMSTDNRKNIFCVIMSSEDYIDAFTKLIALKLKSVQEREIFHVLLDCCLQEKSFNAFYVYLAQKLCEYHRNHQVTLQYSIWDRLKSLDDLNRIQQANLCQFLIHMICNRSLSLTVFRIVEFSELNDNGLTFYKTLFHNLLKKINMDKLRHIISSISKQFLNDLYMFIQQYMDTNTFQEHCEVIQEHMRDS